MKKTLKDLDWRRYALQNQLERLELYRAKAVEAHKKKLASIASRRDATRAELRSVRESLEQAKAAATPRFRNEDRDAKITLNVLGGATLSATAAAFALSASRVGQVVTRLKRKNRASPRYGPISWSMRVVDHLLVVDRDNDDYCAQSRFDHRGVFAASGTAPWRCIMCGLVDDAPRLNQRPNPPTARGWIWAGPGNNSVSGPACGECKSNGALIAAVAADNPKPFHDAFIARAEWRSRQFRYWQVNRHS